MPSKNTIRNFVKGGTYHIYNRGVEKRDVFLDQQDYRMFLYYLKSYLSVPDTQKDLPRIISRLGPGFDLYKNIKLLCYVLMPNHFHFLIKTESERAITEFMKRLSNGYVKYFNEKYERVGPLFQGRYKSIFVFKDEHLLHLSSYIHINPIGLKDYSNLKSLEHYSFSSYPDYIGKRNTLWVFRDIILNYMEGEKNLEYKKQTENLAVVSDKYKKESTPLTPFLLD